MFPSTYFAPTYFAPTYFPGPNGSVTALVLASGYYVAPLAPDEDASVGPSNKLTLRLEQGTSRDFQLQIYNRDGSIPTGLFQSTDTLTTVIWPGDRQAATLTPTTTWISAPNAQFQISFNDADTSSTAPSLYQIVTRATRSGRSAVVLPRGSRFELLDAPGSSTCTDLITQDYLAGALAAGGLRLTTEQIQALPGLTKSASRSIRRHCNRYFNRGGPRAVASGLPAYDGLYAIDWPSRTLLLRQYPINAPPRVRTNPTVVLTVWNNDTTNVQAWVTLLVDGTVEDVDDVSPVTTGLVLYSVANGVSSDTELTWELFPTVGQLAAAISGTAGWLATVEDGFAGWQSTDFRAGQGSQPALGFQSQVGFSVLVDDVPCIYDARTGIVTLSEQDNDPFTSPRFGMFLQTDIDDVTVYGGPQGIRVQYDAGWDIVPEDVQDACVETVLDWMFKKSLDQNLGSESDGARSSVFNTVFTNYALPKSVIGKLAPYRSPRA